jgi:uncharacterized protein YndB with AHSA1/START domain
VIDAMDEGQPMSSDQSAVGVSAIPSADEPAVGVSPVPSADEPAVGVSPVPSADEPAVGVGPVPDNLAMGSVSPEAAMDHPGVLPPVVRTVAASCSRVHAYTTFTARIGEWWPAAFSASGVDLADVVIEPHVGGRVYEISKSGDEFTWGAVKAIQDGTAITMVWTLGVRAPDPTELDVRFAGDITGDLADDELIADVTLRHSGFVSADDYGRFGSAGGWTEVLAAYKACAEA